jgi:hypothetical protein
MKATRRRPINGLYQLDHLQIRRLAISVHGVVLSLDPPMGYSVGSSGSRKRVP